MTALRTNVAIKRRKLSRPAALAVDAKMIHRGGSFFDFGQGRGDDVRMLRRRGVLASGWDPHFAPDNPKRRADTVGLFYVLNVIPSQAERRRVLREAAELAKRWLVVAVRIDQANGTPARDGVRTSTDTFQRNFTADELVDFVRQTLGREPSQLAPGVVAINMRKETKSMPKPKRTTLTQRAVRAAGRLSPKRWLVGDPKSPQRYGNLVQVLAWARIHRKPCRYAVVAHFKGAPQQKTLSSCHKKLAIAREKAESLRKKRQKGALRPELLWHRTVRVAIYDVKTGKKVPLKRKRKAD
jgi:DNA phosphorothioation-associated putative methyltransferase